MEHWSKRHARHKKYRNELIVMKCACGRIELPCKVTMKRIAPRMLDAEENLPMAFKFIKDTLAMWMLGGASGKKDSDPRIKWEYAQEKGKPKEYAIVISIKQVAEIHEGSFQGNHV